MPSSQSVGFGKHLDVALVITARVQKAPQQSKWPFVLNCQNLGLDPQLAWGSSCGSRVSEQVLAAEQGNKSVWPMSHTLIDKCTLPFWHAKQTCRAHSRRKKIDLKKNQEIEAKTLGQPSFSVTMTRLCAWIFVKWFGGFSEFQKFLCHWLLQWCKWSSTVVNFKLTVIYKIWYMNDRQLNKCLRWKNFNDERWTTIGTFIVNTCS